MKRLLKVATIGSIFLLALCTVAAAQTTTVPVTVPGQSIQLPAETITTPQQTLSVSFPTPAPAACTAVGAGRLIPTTAFIANDTVTKAATSFANGYSLSAGQLTSVGQTIELVGTFDLAAGMSGTPQIQLAVDENALGNPVGSYFGTATTATYAWRGTVWITVAAVGTNGEIEVQSSYDMQDQAADINQISGAVTPVVSTTTYALDTTKAHTLGFATGAYSFTGSIQQRQPIGIFFP